MNNGNMSIGNLQLINSLLIDNGQSDIDKLQEELSFIDNLEFELNREDNRIIISKNDYEYEDAEGEWHWGEFEEYSGSFEHNRDELKRAWEDFKDAKSAIKEIGYFSADDENKVPDTDDANWSLSVKINRYAP